MREWIMRSWAVLLVLSTTAAPTISAAAVAADTLAGGPAGKKVDEKQAASKEVSDLVAQLGAGSFLLRERATRRLLEIGLPAKDPLEQALSHPDAEVRLRAERILAIILERDFNVRLEAFAADVDGRHDHRLPGWERFRQTVGATASARQLFVQMQRAEPAVLQASEAGGEMVGAALERRMVEIQEAAEEDSFSRQEVPVGRAAALMFAATPTDILLSDETAAFVANNSYNSPFPEAVISGPQSESLKKLLGNWVSRTEGVAADARLQNIMSAMRLKLPEGLRPAISLLSDQSLQAYARTYPILAVAKLGSKEHLPLLAPLLADETQCNELQMGDRVYSVQVRDVALAATILLSGKDPKEFGFERLQRNEMFVFDPSTLMFSGKKKRKAAFAKWNEFVEKSAAGAQP